MSQNRIFLQDGSVNGRPIYRKIGNRNLYLAFSNVSNYPVPWTMWAGPRKKPGDHIGNIKISPGENNCPQNPKVPLDSSLALYVRIVFCPQKMLFYSQHGCMLNQGHLVEVNTSNVMLECGELVDKITKRDVVVIPRNGIVFFS